MVPNKCAATTVRRRSSVSGGGGNGLATAAAPCEKLRRVAGGRQIERGISVCRVSIFNQECKFGIKGGDNESAYGLNHYENINTDNPYIHVYWGSINPFFYDAWDFDQNIPNETEQCDIMDVFSDGIVNVVDIVNTVNIIFEVFTPSTQQLCSADVNVDGIINVVDVILIVNFILEI